MTEHEQLTLAAKACGLVANYPDERSQWLLVEGVRTPLQGKHRWYWNQLEDDGDCARMEAQLGINVTWLCDGVESEQPNAPAGKIELYSWHAGDKNAARRAASVAVAAEIRRMK